MMKKTLLAITSILSLSGCSVSNIGAETVYSLDHITINGGVDRNKAKELCFSSPSATCIVDKESESPRLFYGYSYLNIDTGIRSKEMIRVEVSSFSDESDIKLSFAVSRHNDYDGLELVSFSIDGVDITESLSKDGKDDQRLIANSFVRDYAITMNTADVSWSTTMTKSEAKKILSGRFITVGYSSDLDGIEYKKMEISNGMRKVSEFDI